MLHYKSLKEWNTNLCACLHLEAECGRRNRCLPHAWVFAPEPSGCLPTNLLSSPGCLNCVFSHFLFHHSAPLTKSKREKNIKALTPKISDTQWVWNRFYGVEKQRTWTLYLFLPWSIYRLSGKRFYISVPRFSLQFNGVTVTVLGIYASHLFITSFKT